MRAPLLVAAVLSTGLMGCPTTRDIDPMEYQPKFKPYRTTDQFLDGRTMRTPPQDTVALEHDTGNPVGLVPDGGVPVPNEPQEAMSPELVQLGQRKWDQVCAVCHGFAGDGNSVVARKMSIRQPPSLLTEQYKNRTDAYVFGVMTNGFGYMNSYREQLSSHDRWAVVAYVRALQLSAGANTSLLGSEDMTALNAPKAAPMPSEGPHE